MKIVSRVDPMELPVPIQRAYGKLIEAIWEHGTLDRQIVELIRMRCAVEVACRL